MAQPSPRTQRPSAPSPPTAPPSPAPPASPQAIERAKVLSVRLSADEFDRLTALATEVGVGPSTLARTLIRRGLTTTPPTEGAASVLERSLIEHLPHQPAALEELAARVAALEAWVASHPDHDER